MKHLKKGRKFSRVKKQRDALVKIMLGNLFLKKKITTTLAKAKELKILAEKIIGQVKQPQAARLLKARLPRNIDAKIISDIAAMAASRKSGYLRVIRRSPRRSDGAPLAIIEIIDGKAVSKEKASDSKTGQVPVAAKKPRDKNL